MKIYTRTGDEGQTGLFGGERVSKDSLRIESYGTVDELNSILGVARSALPQAEIEIAIVAVQNQLFRAGADLASPQGSGMPGIGAKEVAWLEAGIDRMDRELPPLKNFILPGGSPAASQLHVARTVCRRAERLVVRLAREETVDPAMLRYLNRLSDFLFVLARWENFLAGVPEQPWTMER